MREINRGASLPNVLLQILNRLVSQDEVPGWGRCLLQPEITLLGASPAPHAGGETLPGREKGGLCPGRAGLLKKTPLY